MTSGSRGDRTAWWQVEPWFATLANLTRPSRVASWAPVGIILAVDFWSVCALLWELFGRKMLCASNSREDGLHVTHRESEALRNWINKIQGWREIGSHTVPGSGN